MGVSHSRVRLSACLVALGVGLLFPGATLAAAPTLAGDLPVVRFPSEGQPVLESAGETTITVELSRPAARDVSVPFSVGGNATEGADYVLGPSPVVIRAGSTSALLAMTILDDEEHEGTERVELTLGAPSAGVLGEITVHTVAIQDGRLGDPIDGLTPLEADAFRRGRLMFEKRFKPSEGLGPFYNGSSCVGCHSKPTVGGAAELYRNLYLAVYYDGIPANQSSSIPPFLSAVVPAFGSGDFHPTSDFSLQGGRPLIPDTVLGFPVITAQRNPIPVFGPGLFTFISDATIISNTDPNDVDQDDISGRINTIFNGIAVGRLGVKAQGNSIEGFVRGPLQNELGITTDPLLGMGSIVSLAAMQVSADPVAPTTDNDGIPDPELGADDLADLIAFATFLGPPPTKPFTAQAFHGEQVFTGIGCAKCHMPELPSSRGPVRAYSDLLLHAMGDDLADNLKLGDSPLTMGEFRTHPLWGVAAVGPYLHDGRAPTLHDAIAWHGGEAQSIRDAYMALPEADRQALIVFLEHL